MKNILEVTALTYKHWILQSQ